MGAVAITSKAVTLPILEIVQSGKLAGCCLGERMATKQGVYKLVEIGGGDLRSPDDIAVTLLWQRDIYDA